MKDKNKKQTKKSPREKYNLGSFVTSASSIGANYQNAINNLGNPNTRGAGLNGASSGLSAGASIGSAILPGVGSAIGAGLGALGGLIFGNSAAKRAQRQYDDQVAQINRARTAETQDMYDSLIDTDNENPYGVFEQGGEVIIPEQINIEKGELQVDPNTGKILREYTGINPETGGLYQKHNKKGKDTDNNMVTAEDGTFIITTKEAKKYKDAVDNNDKLYQNTIMSNIRNQKAKQMPSQRFAVGGQVGLSNPALGVASSLGNPLGMGQVSPFTGARAIGNTSLNFGERALGALGNINLGGIANTALNYLPAATNIFQGSRQAQQLPYNTIRSNPAARQQILNNLPREISANPALNNIRAARNRAGSSINANTSNPSIARANRLALEGNFLNAENDAIFNTELANNQIRGQRASILSGLDSQDQYRNAQNSQILNNTALQNRQMQLAKEQQFNYGIGQAQQMYQNNRNNNRRAQLDQQSLALLAQIFPNAGSIFDAYRGGN